MDKIMIGAMSNKTQLGFYENAEKVINIPLTIITSFGTVMLPKMSNLVASHNREKDKSVYIVVNEICDVFVLCTGIWFGWNWKGFCPCFLGAGIHAFRCADYGSFDYDSFYVVCKYHSDTVLIPSEKDKEYLSSVIGGAVVNLIANTLLISKIGAIGATIGTILAEILFV